MQQHEEERRDQNRNERAGSLLDWALHVAAKSGLFTDPRRCRRNDDRDHFQLRDGINDRSYRGGSSGMEMALIGTTRLSKHDRRRENTAR